MLKYIKKKNIFGKKPVLRSHCAGEDFLKDPLVRRNLMESSVLLINSPTFAIIKCSGESTNKKKSFPARSTQAHCAALTFIHARCNPLCAKHQRHSQSYYTAFGYD